MTPNQQRAELMLRGIKMKEIARNLGIRAQHVSAVIAGTRRTPYVQAAIANAIGKPVDEVFPEPVTEEAA
jgi:transcriptional regulator with XRE-family HTH domain